jgi:hypothetical protein
VHVLRSVKRHQRTRTGLRNSARVGAHHLLSSRYGSASSTHKQGPAYSSSQRSGGRSSVNDDSMAAAESSVCANRHSQAFSSSPQTPNSPLVQKIDDFEPTARVRPGARLLDRDRRDVDADDIEAVLGQVDGIGAGAAADFECASRLDGVRLPHRDQHRIGRAGIPARRFSRSVAVVPRGMRHAD